jgi:cell division protein FtsZ
VPFTNAVSPGSTAGLSSVTNAPSMGVAQADYTGMSTPAVWRGRTSAAAKVDALSSSGMEDYDIPAFLRKQAD